MAKRPLSNLLALLPRCRIREAEVDALVDTSVYHFLCRVCEEVIGPCVLNCWPRICGCNLESHFFRSEEKRK